MHYEALTSEALKLSARERAEIAGALLRSLSKAPRAAAKARPVQESAKEATVDDLPFISRLGFAIEADASALPYEDQPSSENAAHRVVWIVQSVFGSAGNGGLQQLFEGQWPPGFCYSEIPEACHALRVPRAAQLFEVLLDLFPPEVVSDPGSRRAWLWGEARGSESMPGLVDAMNGPLLDLILEVDVAIINYAMEHSDHFPKAEALLASFGGRKK